MLAVILAPFYLALNYYLYKRSFSWLTVCIHIIHPDKIRFCYRILSVGASQRTGICAE